MKKHLTNIVRKNKLENKNLYKVVLSQNERNLNLPDSLFNTFINSIKQKDIFFYPNIKNLRSKLAKYLGVKGYNLLFTPGSDLGIKTLFECFDLKGKNIITSNYCFPMYNVYAELYECKIKKVRYTDKGLNFRWILDKIDRDTQFIILANPNSPLGDYYTFDQIKTLLDTGIHVIIDEAYIELTDKKSLVKKIKTYTNLTIIRTFSKGYGAAGCRVGYIVSDKSNIDIFNKFRFMYELSGMSAKYCEFILDNIVYFNRYTEKTFLAKNELVERLNKKGYKIIDTSSSWFFLKYSKEIEGLFKKNLVSFRTINHFSDNSKYIKFNYDLELKNTNLIKDLLNVQINR